MLSNTPLPDGIADMTLKIAVARSGFLQRRTPRRPVTTLRSDCAQVLAPLVP